MKAIQAIDLLENGIMPCILYPSTSGGANQYTIDYICEYSSLSSSYEKSSINPPNLYSYQFITLFGNYFYAIGLDEEISINNNSGGGTIAT